MRRILLLIGLVCSLTLPLLAAAQNQVPECVQITPQARWGAGAYNHIVRIQNRCERPIRCRVATDVNPRATQVDVAAGATEEIVTFLGSPARTFTPRVSCDLQR